MQKYFWLKKLLQRQAHSESRKKKRIRGLNISINDNGRAGLLNTVSDRDNTVDGKFRVKQIEKDPW